MDTLPLVCHNVKMERKVWRHKITRAGQVSIPADVRERWAATNVLIVDEGERIVLKPVPENPIEAIRGVLEEKGRSDVVATDAVRQARRADTAAGEKKWRDDRAE
jgi:bifunctional DNA-binding transcriptional regulator/antitoxin component of YhaV-PrlF toxin-antitoxin module